MTEEISLQLTRRELKMLTHIVTRSKAAEETTFMEESKMSEAQLIFSRLHTRILELGSEG